MIPTFVYQENITKQFNCWKFKYFWAGVCAI